MAVKSRASQSGEHAEGSPVKRVTSLYINGTWTPSSGKEVVEVVNPTTGRVIATVPVVVWLQPASTHRRMEQPRR